MTIVFWGSAPEQNEIVFMGADQEKIIIPKNLGVITPDVRTPTYAYESKELGIGFKSKHKDLIIVLSKSGKMEGYIPTNERSYSAEKCRKKEAICEVVNDKIYLPDSGVVNFFRKTSDQTFEEAITDLIQKEGKDPNKCKINIKGIDKSDVAQKGRLYAEISLAEEYKPSEEEIFLQAKKSFIPEAFEDYLEICSENPLICHWAREFLLEEKTKLICSKYAECFGYGCGSCFIYNPAVDNKFIYVSSPPNESSFFSGGPIEILE